MQNNGAHTLEGQPGVTALGHSQAEKAASRERILAAASRQIRREGLEAISVSALMKEAGLTHGGFYGHFESRSALVTQALERALSEGDAKVTSGADGAPFPAIVRGYLSRSHREDRDSGCAIAALSSDVARSDDEARAAMAQRVEAFIASVSAALDQDDDQAILAVSAMVGALTLSRVVTDPARSDAILKAVRDGLTSSAVEPRRT